MLSVVQIRLYVIGTYFNFDHIWRVLSSVVSVSNVTVRMWSYFPSFSDTQVRDMLNSVLAVPLPDALCGLLAGRARFSSMFLHYLLFHWGSCNEPNHSERQKRLLYAHFNEMATSQAEHVFNTCAKDATVRNDVHSMWLAALAGNDIQPRRRGIVHSIDPIGFDVVRKGTNQQPPALETKKVLEPVVRASFDIYLGMDIRPILDTVLVNVSDSPSGSAASSNLDVLFAVLLLRTSRR